MTLNKYQKFCYDHLGKFTTPRVNDRLKTSLSSAHMTIRPDAYLAWLLLTTILVLVCGYVSVVVLTAIFMVLGVDTGMFGLILFIMPAGAAGLTYYIGLSYPGSKARGRAKKIDSNLPYALNFITAMSSAGVTPTEIFKSLSKQTIYGEIKDEAAWVYRDIALLGSDIISAIRANIERTPSVKFKEFLQGLVVTVTSGGSLKSYFMSKADQYMIEHRTAQKQDIESLGIMAEAYVTAAVAGVLLLLIVIPLMMIISGQFNEFFLYTFIFVIAPLIHMGFVVVVKSMSGG